VIVLDASAIFELVTRTARGSVVARRIADPEVALHAPHLVDLEVVQTLRRYERSAELDEGQAAEALRAFMDLDLERHEHAPLLARVWHLRENLTAYDAAYVALAEALDAKLVTCDARLARAPGMARRADLID
jgi:predicted nucleic acid-binding protein